MQKENHSELNEISEKIFLMLAIIIFYFFKKKKAEELGNFSEKIFLYRKFIWISIK